MRTTDKMGENLKKYRTRLEEIRSDWTRSAEAKRRDLRVAYEEARATHGRLADEYRKGLKERLERTRTAAFSAPKVDKAPALDVLVYRDALDRVSKRRDPRELTDTLARAQMPGDVALAKACLFRGYELENPNIVGAYFEGRPDELPAWEEFMGAAQEHNALENLGMSGAAGVPEPERPEELGPQGPRSRTGASLLRAPSAKARESVVKMGAEARGGGPQTEGARRSRVGTRPATASARPRPSSPASRRRGTGRITAPAC